MSGAPSIVAGGGRGAYDRPSFHTSNGYGEPRRGLEYPPLGEGCQAVWGGRQLILCQSPRLRIGGPSDAPLLSEVALRAKQGASLCGLVFAEFLPCLLSPSARIRSPNALADPRPTLRPKVIRPTGRIWG